MQRKLYLIILLMLSALGMSAASVQIEVTAGRGKRSIAVGDQFYMTIVVSNSDAEPTPPRNMPGAKLMYFDQTGTSWKMSTVNGATTRSSTVTYTATFRAQKEGTYSYGPISVGGARSNSVRYTIGKGGAAPQSIPGNNNGGASASAGSDDDGKPKFIGKGDGNLFMRANVTKTTAYEQEALVYTVKLYTTYDTIKFIGATAAPKFDGFVVEESKDVSTQLNYESYQGKMYATAIIARYIIFPQMTGNLKVTGNTYTVSVDRREYYHDPFWGSMSYSTPLQLNVTPNDLVVNVKPLPSPKPADFSGGVGKFRISSDLKSHNLKTNQAGSIVYTVTGTGNIKYIQLPDLSVLYPPEIEIYSPKSDQKVEVGSANVSGSVTFDYSFMPLEEGQFKIPDVKLVYFNPETGQYETSVAKGYTVNVGKGEASKSGSRKNVRFDSNQQNVKASSLSKSHEPMIESFVYWLWFIIPAVLLLGGFAYYQIYTKSHADMVAFNSRRADKIARRRLKRAAAAIRKNDPELFYTELLKALWGYLGDKLKMPTSELMRDNIRQMLLSKNIEEVQIDSLIGLIDDAEFAKYSSAGRNSGLDAMYKRAISIINQLEDSFKKSK